MPTPLIEDAGDQFMPWLYDLIYRSQNGDVWQLLRETPSKRILVRHTGNAASGGYITDLSVEAFLSINGSGPEHQALRVMLVRLGQPRQS